MRPSLPSGRSKGRYPPSVLLQWNFHTNNDWCDAKVFAARRTSLHDIRAGKEVDGVLTHTSWRNIEEPRNLVALAHLQGSVFLYSLRKPKAKSIEEELAMLDDVEEIDGREGAKVSLEQ